MMIKLVDQVVTVDGSHSSFLPDIYTQYYKKVKLQFTAVESLLACSENF